MARATPESIKLKIPKSFQEIGGPTHMMFEELVIRAETDDMKTLTLFTGEIMKPSHPRWLHLEFKWIYLFLNNASHHPMNKFIDA